MLGTIRRTPVAPTLDGTELGWLIEQFVIDRRTKLDNQKTVNSYGCRLTLFVAWWSDYGPRHQWRIQASDFAAFECALREYVSPKTGRVLKWSYRASTMHLLREVFHWACERGYTDHDYAQWIPNAHGYAPIRKAATTSSALALLTEAGNSRFRTRDQAMIAMLVGMGLRRSEVSGVDIERIVFYADASGYVHVYGKRTKANPTGERNAAFDSATGNIILAHLDAYGYTYGPLFRNRFGERLTPTGVHQTVKTIISRANLDKEIRSSHDLRRGFTTYWARSKPGPESADLRRRQLGHANYSQTTEYTLYEVDDIREQLVSAVSLWRGDDE